MEYVQANWSEILVECMYCLQDINPNENDQTMRFRKKIEKDEKWGAQFGFDQKIILHNKERKCSDKKHALLTLIPSGTPPRPYIFAR